MEYRQAVKHPTFYLAGVTVLLTGFMLQGISSAYNAHLKDIGIDPGYIATIASVSSLLLTCSKLLVGVMYDKLGLRTVMLICQSSAVLAFAVLLLINTSAFGLSMAVIYTIFKALALPLETLMIPLIVYDLFGDASADKILGVFLALNYTGYALGEPIINLCYDVLGSYNLAFAICAVLMLAITVLFRFALRSGYRDKIEILDRQELAAE